MELSDKTLHYIIIGILVVVIILLAVHIFQMRKENFDNSPLSAIGTGTATMDVVADPSAQVINLTGVDQANARNQVINTQYYGGSTGEFVGGDNMVGDNNVTV